MNSLRNKVYDDSVCWIKKIASKKICNLKIFAEKRHRFCAFVLHLLDRYDKREVSKEYALLWVNNQYKHTCLLYLSNTKIWKKEQNSNQRTKKIKDFFWKW